MTGMTHFSTANYTFWGDYHAQTNLEYGIKMHYTNQINGHPHTFTSLT